MEGTNRDPCDPNVVQSAPAPGWYRDPRSRLRLRWWDGRAWTGRTGVDPSWSTALLWAGLSIPAWVGAALFSMVTASAISETPQPDQTTSVVVVSGLPLVPIAAAVLGGLIALAVTRRWRPAVTVSGVTLLCLSILIAFVVTPKPP